MHCKPTLRCLKLLLEGFHTLEYRISALDLSTKPGPPHNFGANIQGNPTAKGGPEYWGTVKLLSVTRDRVDPGISTFKICEYSVR